MVTTFIDMPILSRFAVATRNGFAERRSQIVPDQRSTPLQGREVATLVSSREAIWVDCENERRYPHPVGY
jgi:hypothetical protein